MDEAIRRFYVSAVKIGNHPFIEFAGVMQSYLESCRRAHAAGIDFTQCNRHAAPRLQDASSPASRLRKTRPHEEATAHAAWPREPGTIGHDLSPAERGVGRYRLVSATRCRLF
jgi:hypothetical protein